MSAVHKQSSNCQEFPEDTTFDKDCRFAAPLEASRGVAGNSGSDFAELFEGGFEILDDFLGGNVGSGKIVGFSEPEDVEAGNYPVNENVVI